MTTLTLDLDKTDKTDKADTTSPRLRGVRVWLFVVAAMIAAIVLVGGATRLTESGLSIVEWKPIEGALPPLSDAQWNDAFEAYKTIPQYSAMNRGMSLPEFKNIYWWEWSHRLLGRLIGTVFLLPFLWFLWRGVVPRAVRPRLWVIFALGGLQGAVGWWMVASGLEERTEVSQYRLATHLILALVIYAATVWTLRGLGSRVRVEVPRRLKITSLLLVALTFIQIYFGALVAGLRAGLVYNTWPLIDGTFIPDSARLFLEQPAWRNFFDNTLTVQFTHRMIAYTLLAVGIAHVADC
jgi:heme a synthase